MDGALDGQKEEKDDVEVHFAFGLLLVVAAALPADVGAGLGGNARRAAVARVAFVGLCRAVPGHS
jgi:hypothetical protein